MTRAPGTYGGGSVVALCGGVGGAKLALGLANIVPPGKLTIIVNTGDDFDHLGLRICPDIDTVTYTLAGVANPDTGWGCADETWSFMERLHELGQKYYLKKIYEQIHFLCKLKIACQIDRS